MGKYVRRTVDVLKRITSMMLVVVMLFLAAAVHIPAETFLAADAKYLAGSFPEGSSITGTWAEKSEDGQMEYLWGDFYYKKVTFNEVGSGGAAIEFKVTNGTWDDTYGNGADNYSYTVPEGATAIEVLTNVAARKIIVYNNKDNEGSIIENASYVELAGGDPSDTAVGQEGINWSLGDGTGDMEYLGDGLFYTKITFPSGFAGVTFNHKITFMGAWDGAIDNGSGGNRSLNIPANTTSVEFIADVGDRTVYTTLDSNSLVPALIKEYTEEPVDITLHFKNSTELTAKNLYSWQFNSLDKSRETATWPGAAVTADTLYKGYTTATVPYYGNGDLYFIFNDGTNQTSDLSVTPSNQEYWIYNNGTEYVVSATNPESITLSETELNLNTKDTATLTPTVAPDGTTVEWSSDNTSVATVDNGVVTAVGVGTATITASTPTGKKATCVVNVTETIELDKETLALKAGEEAALTATTKPADKTVTWTSSDETVATVENGVVTAVGAGTATITASISEDVKATCVVTVGETITLNKSSLTLEEELTEKLIATTQPSDVEVTWKSSDETVATVDENGVVTAVAAGTATITATTPGKDGEGSASATCTVTVTEKTVIPANSVTLDKEEMELVVGTTGTLTATTDPAGKAVTWKSSDETVATVDASGNVTALKAGTTTITVTVDDKTDTCVVTVIETIELDKETLSLVVYGEAQLTATKVPDTTTVTWESSDKTVATVDENGKVTAVGKGEATITATTAGGAKDTCTVTVEESIELEQTTLTLVAEDTATLTVKAVAPTDTTVTWTSSNEKVATVKDGVVTAVGYGTATITATTAGGATATCTVTVEEAIELDQTTLELVAGETATLEATTKPADAKVTWKSDKTSVATVDENGKVTAVAAGTAVITATTANGATASCTVTVEAKTYIYTIYTYSANADRMNVNNSALWIWDLAEEAAFNAQLLNFATVETLSDGNTWLKATFETTALNLGLIFKNNGSDWAWQTADYNLANTAETDLTLYLVDGINGTVFTDIPAAKSPVVDGTTVTFYYNNVNNYSSLALRGSMNDWGETAMTKSGKVFTYTTTLAPGVYEYKFYNGTDWFADPLNPLYGVNADGTGNDNSRLIVSGFLNAAQEVQKGITVELPATLNYVDASGTTHEKISVSYAMAGEDAAAGVTLEGTTLFVPIGYAEENLSLTVCGTVNGEDVYSVFDVSLYTQKYKYTIYAHSPIADRNSVDDAALWIWDAAGETLLQSALYNFTATEVIDGKTWLKTEIEVTASEQLGFIMKNNADTWVWQTSDLLFSNTARTDQTIYIVDGHSEVFTDIEDIPELKYVYVEYEREDGDYTDTWVYAWNNGYTQKVNDVEEGLHFPFEEVNGQYIAKIPVVAGDSDKTIGFIVKKGLDWNGKDGGDNFVKVDADFVKVRFANGAITKVLSNEEGAEIDRKNNTITFYYRDKDLFEANNLASLDGKVKLYLIKETAGVAGEATETDMIYDEENERFYCQLDLTEDTDYYYYYLVNGEKVLDTSNPKTGVLGEETYSLARNKVYNVTLTATVLNASMDYNDNNVISLSWAPKTEADSLDGFNPEHIYVDLSELGLSSKAEMNTELLEFTFGCAEGIEAGPKTITVTLVDDCDMSYYATVTVNVTERDKTDDFDWDEAVIYFAVTDRFFDGNTNNNTVTDDEGTTTAYDPENPLGVHGGDFAGLTAKLDYLKTLGVNTIWITPIVDNIDEPVDGTNQSYGYHGYWSEDFTALNPHLGTEAELKALIDAAHAKGMKIMVDVVLNHAGYETDDVFNSIIPVEGAVDGEGNQVYKDMIRAASISSDDEKMSLSGLPDFLTEDPEVRALLIEWQTSWMSEFDIDYYRVDTVKHVDDATWEAFKNALTAIDPEFKLIGEYYDAGYLNDYDQLDSGKMDSLLDFHFNDILGNLASEDLAAIESALQTRNTLLTNTATMGSFLSSHDENGFLYDLVNKYGESEEWANALMKVAATYQITAKGQPVIYYGEEIGLTGANNYPAQENRYDFDWSLATDSNPMYKHYKTMLNIRRDYSEVFSKGERYSVVLPNVQNYDGSVVSKGYEVFARSYEGETIYVGTNVWGDAISATFYVNGAAGSTYTDLYSGKTYTVSATGQVTVSIPSANNGGTVVLVQTSGDAVAVEDTNEVTVKIHYKRADGNYTDWNAWLWSDNKGGAQYDFVEENGEMVATITVEGRKTNNVNFRIRLGDWKDNDHNAKDQSINISDVVSGTVHYYVESGVWGGIKVLGSDAIVGNKIVTSEFDRNTNTFKIVTTRPISGNFQDAFDIECITDNEAITITNVSENGCTYTVSIDEDLTSMRAVLKGYVVTFDGYEYTLVMPNIYSTKEFEDAYTYDGDDLGLTYSETESVFKVWAPTADAVVLNVYASGTKGTEDLIESYEMTAGEKGVWSYTLEGDWNGKYYTYSVSVNNETNEVCDPYARTTGVNGNRAMILDLESTDPEGWAEDTGAHAGMSYTDAVIYELHVRDLSIDDSSGISDANQGKFLGLTETGTTTEDGTPTGLDHMIDLGVTHVHLLPIYDYASVDESRLDEEQFNWGYDPLNYNVPEGSYSTDPYDGATRVNEMKQMVMALHENNINVIMDVVYNHVYDAGTFSINQIVPSYFSRTNADGTFSNGSGCGNDTASERSMVHKYIVESILYWHEEYHIDGFRFDLVGLLDTETINTIVEEVHAIDPNIIFYGEGWTLGTAVSKDGYSMATQTNAYMTPDFAYFSDTLRNGVAGSNIDGQGFIWGVDNEDLMRQCFTATTWWCPEPTQTINYVSCHDNYTLMDKINEVSNAAYDSYDDAPGEYQVKLNNLAASFYMLSEGIPLIHAGEEMLRTKLDEDGTVIHNSYNASDFVNKLRWYNLDGNALYADTVDYYEGLIEFRKNHEALRLTTSEEVAANVAYKWVTNDVIMFVINGKASVPGEVSDGIVIIYNASDSNQTINLGNYGVASGTWNICINAQDAGTDVLGTVTNGQVTVESKSAMALVKGETVDTESVYTANNKVTISLDRTIATVAKDATTTLTAIVNPADSTLVWTSADESVATVKDGVITGVGTGTTTITVSTLHGVTATCTVTVTETPVVETISLDKTTLTLEEEETETLVVTVSPEGTAVTWTSSDEEVATVDQTGKVTAVGEGETVITVTTAGGATASCTVTVTAKEEPEPPTPPVEETVTLNKTTLTLEEEETETLVATVTPEGTAVTWTSSDEEVATVDQTGKVTAVGEGETVITVTTAGGKTASCTVTVTAKEEPEPPVILVTGISLNAITLELEIEDIYTLIATVAPENATNKAVAWSTSDAEVVMVDAQGNVTALAAGTATITATAKDGSGIFASCTVTVKAPIADGLHQAEDGTWYYYLGGEIATEYTGLVEHFGSWYYVEAGILNWNYTGLTDYYGTWYYVEGGILNWNYTGLAAHYGSWYYVEGGILNWNYTGLTDYYGTWYYVAGGILDWNYTGLTYFNENWFYVESGILNWNYTGLTNYNGTWYFVQGGILNWNYTGLVEYYGSWYYVAGGILNWDYTGLTCYFGTWYYVEGGILNWNYTGLVSHEGNWYYVEGGILNWNFTGLVNYHGVWYYVDGGILNWNFTGTVYQYGTWWYVENGIMIGVA